MKAVKGFLVLLSFLVGFLAFYLWDPSWEGIKCAWYYYSYLFLGR